MEEIIRTTISTTINEIIKNSNLLYYDISTLVISIVALIISIWSAIWTARQNNKLSFKNHVYEDLLKKPLQVDLPKFVQKSIDYTNKKIDDEIIDEFQDFLMNFREQILLFKFTNERFYKKIDNIIIKIDDNIVLITNKQENFEVRYNELVKQVKELYRCVEKYLYK